MKSVAVLALASGLFTLASAQTYPVITADDVLNSTREIWCQQQMGICPNLCQDQAHVDPVNNDCWSEDLHYECVCKGGFRPNLTEYSQTIPYNLCMQSIQACADNCGNNQDCVTLCFSKKQCGASDPRRVNTTSTTTTVSATGTATNSDSSSPTSSPNTFGENMGVALAAFGSAYGVGAMIAAMAIGFFGML
ncbi:hypothetical protein EV426DRAFT_712423 [Tirmania nivea]|nr:hypothetical protein EV426DRAFT_712423 [Tirmania nivea]